MSKMYIIVRQDLSPGSQIAQSVHAATQFFVEHFEVGIEWFYNSNTIVCLSVRDFFDLLDISQWAKQENIKYSLFYEPDMNNEPTALALEPTQKAVELCKGLPLALSGLI